jgi:hypothetical protein
MNIAPIRRYSNTKSIIAAALLLLLTGETACKRAEFDPLRQGWKKVGNEPLASAPLLRQAEESSCIWQINQKWGKVTVSRGGNLEPAPPRDSRADTEWNTRWYKPW